MRGALFLSIAIVFIYLGISTIFQDFAFVGKVGAFLGAFNRKFFGYLSFIYPFLLLIPLWAIYKYRIKKERLLEWAMGFVILFFSLLLLQALIFNPPLNGKIGSTIVLALAPYIGKVGVWLILLLFVGIAYIVFGQDILKALMKKVQYKEKLIITPKNIVLEKVPLEDVEPIVDTAPKPLQTPVVESVVEEKKPKVRLVKKAQNTTTSKSTSESVSKEKPTKESKESKKEPKQPKELKESKKSTQKKKSSSEEKKPSVRIVSELEENKKLLASIETGKVDKPQNFQLPTPDFLQEPPKKRHEINEHEIDKKVGELIEKLKRFKIEGDVVRTYTGPLVTTFEFKPAPHIKVSKILNLADDLAMALKAKTIRIQAPIPGKDVVGIEIPNEEFETIYLREIIESDLFKKAASPLTMALGKDIVGKPFITDLKKLPHLLIAGTTGSGKSVGINAMVVSLLYRNSPDQLKFMMIDPKMLEFSIYNDIPHLLTPVITSSKQAVVALSNMVAEMERRYQLMSQAKTKNIEGYNKKIKKEGGEELPYIVVIIDELADLMMTSGKDVEHSIARLAQMARASGIHLIVATQRPSVDVVTGLIKANLPSRISFRVGQKIDSKVILDSIGAESLLGRGDMLFTPPGANGLIRLHAPWVSEQEIEKIVEFLKAQRAPEYDERFLAENLGAAESGEGGGSGGEELDELYEEAKKIVLSERKTSISYLQRRLQIGYNRAARIIEQLENMGVLSAPNAKGNREILV